MRRRMNRLLRTICISAVAACIGLASCTPPLTLLPEPAAEGLPRHPNQIGVEQLEFSPSRVERWELKNGLVVFYQYDDELPLVSGTLYLPGGSLIEPEDLTGLASAVGSQMRNGGTRSMTPEQLDARLDDLGASISSSYAGEYGSVSFDCLSDDFEEIFKHFYEVAAYPRFDPERFDIWKHLAVDSINRRRDNPGVMASMIFTSVVYGHDNPYAREATPESINKITLKSLKDFHRKFVRPLGARLALSGAVRPEKLKELLASTFSQWDSQSIADITWPKVDYKPTPGIYLLTRDFEQAQVFAGHIGPPRMTPDQHSMVLFNRLFGFSGLDSLLFREIRSKMGLAYSVYGGVFPGRTAGTFEIQLGTRNKEAANAIRKLDELIRYPRDSVFEPVLVDAARSAVEQSFVFKFPSIAAIVNRAAILEHLGYPKDYDLTYLDRISQVAPGNIQDVAKRWVHPDSVVYVVVGNIEAEQLRDEFQGRFEVFEVDFDVIPRIKPPE